MKKNLVIVVGVPVLLFFLIVGFLNGAKQTKKVVVAKRFIGAGMRLSADMVGVKEIAKRDVAPDAFTDPKEVVGQVVTVSRAPGDQITRKMVGSKAVSALAAGLKPDHRIIAIKVDRASGLAGMLQVGDRVSVVGIINPNLFQRGVGLISSESAPPPAPLRAKGKTTPTPTAEPKEPSPVAMFVASGITVKFVPWSFRYSEAPTEGYSKVLAASAKGSDVVLLDVPVKPVSLTPNGPVVSLPEFLPLVQEFGKLYLTLDPTNADYSEPPVGAALMPVYKYVLENAPMIPVLSTPTAPVKKGTATPTKKGKPTPAKKATPTPKGKGGK